MGRARRVRGCGAVCRCPAFAASIARQARVYDRSSISLRARAANSSTGTAPMSPSPVAPHRHLAGLGLASPTTSMYGDLAQLGLADLAAHRLRAVVDLDAETGVARASAATSRAYVLVAVGDRQHQRLHRRQPERELAGVVLDQDADEALEGAEQRAVDHHRPVLGVVGAGVGRGRSARACSSRAARCRAATSGRSSRSCAGRSSGRRRRRRPR